MVQGRAFVYQRNELEIPSYQLNADEFDSELARFDQAILETRAEINAVRNKVAANLGEGEARIFDAHLMVLEDAALIDEVIADMRETQHNIEFCYDKVARRYMAFFSSMEDDYLKERVTDIQDVSRRLLHRLIGLQNVDLAQVSVPSIIVSTDITPSDTANLDRDKLLGFITDVGGRTSHSVIMARSQQVPAVVGLHDASHLIRTGDHAPNLNLLAVTVLTSMDNQQLSEINVQANTEAQVRTLAEISLKAGAQGLVCSSLELALLRTRFGNDPILVTPGIRPAGSDTNEQKRVMTPKLAATAGSNFIVVGRPILRAEDPAAAARAITADLV